MMLELKDYQKNALRVLRAFLEEARVRTPAEAFAKTVRACPTDTRPQLYHTRWNLDATPYVCLRLPTGGGKTLLAAHSIATAADAFLDRDFPFVLWLVPTNTIRKQTVAALRKAGHPYHQALAGSFGEQNLAVFDIEDVNNIRPQDAFEKTCIVVATMQTLRISNANKLKRKVYGHNENFERHFARLSSAMPGLDRLEDGSPVFSFVNMVHQLRPLVIVDEAHKMISELSGEVIGRINPACVLEFTATPVESNVLFRAFPSQLKAEEMVKLPFNLLEHQEWESAVRGALRTRESLAELARDDRDYIRPLILFQAEKANQSCTVARLKEFLLDEGVREEEIAIATGEQRELDAIDLFDPQCPVKCIITVEALKEGWDCSFAYVFCSVANISSAIDVEQFLGRVMRMPYAAARAQEKLNMAYAHVVAPGFGKAAEEINARLCNMGFDAGDAADNIRQLPLPGTAGDIWGDKPLLGLLTDSPQLVVTLDAEPDFSGLEKEETGHIAVRRKDGKVTLTTSGMVTGEVEERIVAAAAPEQQFQVRHSIRQHRQRLVAHMPPTPAARGVVFAVPLLLWEKDEEFEPADAEFLLSADWSPLAGLSATAPLFRQSDFAYDPRIKAFQFDLCGERLTYSALGEMEQGFLYAMPQSYDEFALARWLDRHCRQDDVSQADMLEFCRRAVQSLRDAGHGLDILFQGKKLIARLILEKISALREGAKKTAFQSLLAGAHKTKMVFDDGFTFPNSHYAEHIPRYQGAYQFKKHYLDIPRDLKAKGEEFRCARDLDLHPQVETWLRNVDRQPGSFYLPTSSDNFYPDFVAKLADGRTLLMEYKGAHLLDSPDTREKVNIGKFWEAQSQGKGVFALVCEARDEYTFEKQMKKICG